MDSKYSVFGETSGVKANNFKRKKHLGDMQIKKIKLLSVAVNNSDVKCQKPLTNKENNIVRNTAEDLLVSRQKLPVYMVKSR